MPPVLTLVSFRAGTRGRIRSQQNDDDPLAVSPFETFPRVLVHGLVRQALWLNPSPTLPLHEPRNVVETGRSSGLSQSIRRPARKCCPN